MTSDYWQHTKEQLWESGQHLLETGLWSDCSFIVGQEPQQQTFKSHKSWLAMSSPVFEAMFFGNLAEKNDPISITDVQPEAFKILLEYIYTRKVILTFFKLACDVHYCAEKYMLPTLTKECINYLMSKLSPGNACMAYEFAIPFKESEQELALLNKSMEIIATKTSEVLIGLPWKKIKLETLLTILDLNSLQIKTEVELFRTVEVWAKAECKRQFLDPRDGKSLRSVIGNALSKIRFLCLTPEEFVHHVVGSPLLTEAEAYAVLTNIILWNSMKSIPQSYQHYYEEKRPMPEGFSINKNKRTSPIIPVIPIISQSTNFLDYLDCYNDKNLYWDSDDE